MWGPVDRSTGPHMLDGGVYAPRRADSDRADDLVGLQALGADVQALGRPIDQGANALNVRIPPAVGANVRVRHALAEAGSLTAHVTNGSHDVLLGMSSSSVFVSALAENASFGA